MSRGVGESSVFFGCSELWHLWERLTYRILNSSSPELGSARPVQEPACVYTDHNSTRPHPQFSPSLSCPVTYVPAQCPPQPVSLPRSLFACISQRCISKTMRMLCGSLLGLSPCWTADRCCLMSNVWKLHVVCSMSVYSGRISAVLISSPSQHEVEVSLSLLVIQEMCVCGGGD